MSEARWSRPTPEEHRARARRCLLGFAAAYGPGPPAPGEVQVLAVTVEALIRAGVRQRGKGIVHIPSVLEGALRRWLRARGEPVEADPDCPPGWLLAEPAFVAGTPVDAATAAALLGGRADPADDGPGALLRSPAYGLCAVANPFELAAEGAQVTHAHPQAWGSAGALAAVVGNLVLGLDLRAAVDAAAEDLQDAGLGDLAGRLRAAGSGTPARTGAAAVRVLTAGVARAASGETGAADPAVAAVAGAVQGASGAETGDPGGPVGRALSVLADDLATQFGPPSALTESEEWAARYPPC